MFFQDLYRGLLGYDVPRLMNSKVWMISVGFRVWGIGLIWFRQMDLGFRV